MQQMTQDFGRQRTRKSLYRVTRVELDMIENLGTKVRSLIWPVALYVTVWLGSFAAAAQGYPTPKEADWVARDFRFHTGEVMPELRLHYLTIGEPSGEP